MKTISNALFKKVVIIAFVASLAHSGIAQQDQGTVYDHFVVNTDYSEFRALLRLASKNSSTNTSWNMINERGDLWWGHTTNTDLNDLGTERMRLTTGGKLGIGTKTPSEKLDVVGTVKATKFIGDGSQLTGISGSGTPYT